MRRFRVGALVRNNRLPMMQAEGVHVDYDVLNNQEYALALKDKLLEEAQELSEAADIDSLKKELVDVLEVIEHLVAVHGFDKAELEAMKAQKQAKIGAFDQKIRINFVEMLDNHPDVDYYLENARKYSEIF